MSQQTEDTVWEDPPPKGSGAHGKWGVRLAPLRQHPGKWARFDDIATGVASNIRNGSAEGVTKGEFEVTTRDGKAGNSRCSMFVRFVGEES